MLTFHNQSIYICSEVHGHVQSMCMLQLKCKVRPTNSLIFHIASANRGVQIQTDPKKSKIAHNRILLDHILYWFFKTELNRTEPHTNILIYISIFISIIYYIKLLFFFLFNSFNTMYEFNLINFVYISYVLTIINHYYSALLSFHKSCYILYRTYYFCHTPIFDLRPYIHIPSDPEYYLTFQSKIRQRGILKYLLFVPIRTLFSLYLYFLVTFIF